MAKKSIGSSSKREFSGLMNMLGFIGIMFIALALVLAKIFGGGQLTAALTIIANVIAYLITAIAVFYYARSRNNIWYFVAFLVAVILIVIFMVI